MLIDVRDYWDNIPEWEGTAKLLTTPTLDYDRELASQAFRETIIACNMPKLQAYIMYWIMNIYKIIFSDWRKPKNYDNKQCRSK